MPCSCEGWSSSTRNYPSIVQHYDQSSGQNAGCRYCPTSDLTFAKEENEHVKNLSPSPKQTCQTDSPVSTHPLHLSSCRLKNQNASAFAYAPPLAPLPPPIEVEKLNIFIQTTLPASPQLTKQSSHAPADLLTEEHVPVLQQCFHLIINELSGGFPGTSADLAGLLWDLIETQCTRHKYARRAAKDA